MLCAGSCEKTWPALARPAGTKVAPAVPGVKGTTKRPAGSAHVTWNYLPSCTYVPDRPGVVPCGNQDGWFATSSNVPARAGTSH